MSIFTLFRRRRKPREPKIINVSDHIIQREQTKKTLTYRGNGGLSNAPVKPRSKKHNAGY